MTDQLDLANEASKLPYDSKRHFLLSQEETSLHKLLCSVINNLGDDYKAEITHGPDERGRDLVVKHKDAFVTQYIGVIVKKGNSKGELTGETDGVIDDVISQTSQAIALPCLLRELTAGTVKINQLWIFFVGRLTRAASERIEHQLKNVSNKIFVLDEIIELFSKYYPQVFFNPALAKFVQDNLARIEELDKTGAAKRDYFSPSVSKWENASDITESLVANVMYANKMPFTKLIDIISAGKRIILTGEPGAGKTTALVKIASDMFKNNFFTKSKNPEKPLEVPILIKATELVEKGMETIYREDFALTDVKEQITIKTLLVDGLDEVSVDKREHCVTEAQKFAHDHKCGLVITCRKIPMVTTVLSPFDRYELLPLEYQQAITFIERALKDKRLIDVLKDGILRNELKMDLTPMALELLIEVASYEKEVPASLAEIFERYTDITCGKYDKSKGIDIVFEHHIKKRFPSRLSLGRILFKRNA